MFERITKNEDETRAVGREIGKKLSAPACIMLKGDLGAGKTVISSGIIEELTGKKHTVTSPTFNLVYEYDGKIHVNHFDLYRMESVDELENIGAYEYFYNNEQINIVEWPERAPEIFEFLPCVYLLEIRKIDDKTRKINFEKIKG